MVAIDLIEGISLFFGSMQHIKYLLFFKLSV